MDCKVNPDVPPIAQPTDNTCWAAAATMMISWRDNTVYDIPVALQRAGQSYVDAFTENNPLDSISKPLFLAALRLSFEFGATYTPAGLCDLIRNNGPIWVTTKEGAEDSFSVHARILVEVFGDGGPDTTMTRFIDPDGGSSSVETVSQFTKKFENAEGTIQIVHF